MRPITLSQTGVGNSVPIPCDIYLTPFNVSLGVEVTGTVTYSVQWTFDDVWDPNATITWDPAAANLTAAVDNQQGSLVSPVTAVRLSVTAGTGTAKLRLVQAGVFG